MKKIYPILLCFLWLYAGNLNGQIYPISIVTQTIPPHTGSLEQFTVPGSNKVMVNLILHDAHEISYQVRLKVSIEGNGILITSNDNFLPPPITLSYGNPISLSGRDLSPYFDPNNLNFNGYSMEQYINEGGLPDGQYTICFQVFDYDRSEEKAASLQACSGIFAILHDAPVILSPIGTQTVTYPQYVPIQWQARHTGGFPTEYKVEIYEWDETSGLTADLVIDFEQPFYETTVIGTTTTALGPADLPLGLGTQYLIRVQASDMTMMNGFKNDGWSDIEVFQYGEGCPFPEGISAETVNHESVNISWNPVVGPNNQYVVRYRQKDLEDANWYEEQVDGTLAAIENLTDNTTYEYQVLTLCGGEFEGELSPVDTITTDTLAEAISCSYDYELPEILSTEPGDLSIGDQIYIAGFRVLVLLKEASTTTPGAWNGVGKVQIPWLRLWVNVYFEDIFVNEQKQIYEGSVIAVSEGLEGMDGFMSPEEVYAQQQLMNDSTNFCGVPLSELAETETTASTEEEGEEPFGGEGWLGGYIAEHGSLPAVLSIGGISLPYGFSGGGGSTIIAIDSMEFTTEGASLKAFASLNLATSQGIQYISFRSDINFHPGGFTEQPKLYLANNAGFTIMEKAMLTLIAGDNTYISWDCEGVNAISIEGQVDFCKDLIISADFESEELDSTQNVTGTFLTVMPEWKDFVAEISITPFALPQLPDWTWEVQSAVIDLSDVYTPETVNFPEDYEHPDLDFGSESDSTAVASSEEEATDSTAAWKGFYLGQVRVKLPKKFSQDENGEQSTETITIGANDIIIDRTGFTGYIYANNLLSLEQGQIGTWAFSIDSLGIGLQSNQFTHAAFSGKIVAPPFPVDTLGVSALIQPDSAYLVTVEILEDLSLDVWKANITLAANSSITIDYLTEEETFGATAVLHGSASLQPTVGDGNDPNADKVEIIGVNFQDFTISSRGRFIQNVGSWSLSSAAQDRMAGFPLVIHEIALIQDTSENEIILGLDAEVILTGSSGGEFSGRGVIRIVGEMVYNELLDRDLWRFKKVRLDALSVDVSTAGMAFHGAIQFYEKDPTYGRGYRGEIGATFQPGITVAALAQFGKIEDMRYFFVDALVAKDPGVPIGNTGLALYGFGGGAFYHMRREGFSQIQLPDAANPGSAPNMMEIESELGASLTGTTYIPDSSMLIGVKAMVAIGTIQRTTFNGDATLEVTINAAGGLDAINFQGTGRFMTPVDGQGQPTSDPALTCELEIVYDHQNSSLHATLGVYVNKPPITGGYDNNYAGTGEMHYDADDWYIYLGVPETPIVLSMDVEGLDYIQPVDISMSGYFNMGSLLPEFPGLPPEVQDILGDLDIVSRDDPKFANAEGVLFGANLSFDMPGLEYLMFYATFGAGAGFDMMLRNYEGGLCAFNANDPNAPTPGINGWYGSGQMYAYLQGDIGIEITINYLFSSSTKRISILEIGAAAVLQAQLPNPLWARGNVGGYFSVLSGLVSGTVNFQFETGRKCDIWGANPLAGIEFISDTSPNNNTNTEVDVFLRPQATFNIPVGESIELEDDEGVRHFYRSVLDEFRVYHADDDQNIIGAVQWNERNDVVALRPDDVLPGTTELVLSVRLKFETRTLSTDWETLTQGNGQPITESKVINFITGVPPNYIPQDNVAYSYPVHKQFNFLKSEGTEAYIQLKQGQDYLFEKDPNEWISRARYIQNGTVLTQVPVGYDNNQNRVSYGLPANELANSTITQSVLLFIPTSSEEAVDANVVGVETELFSNQDQVPASSGEPQDFTQVLMERLEVERQLDALNEDVIITFNFRTSQYNTLDQKLNAFNTLNHWFDPMLIDTLQNSGVSIDDIGFNVNAPEGFDKFDLHGYFNGEEDIAPLLYLEADLDVTGNNWYYNHPYPFMYQHLPTAAIQLTHRDPNVLGQVPVRAINFKQFDGYNNVELSEENIATNSWSFPPQLIELRYKLPYYMLIDYFDYKNNIVNYYYNQAIPTDLQPIVTDFFVYPNMGDYRLKVKYKLPGQSPGAYQRDYDIHYGTSN